MIHIMAFVWKGKVQKIDKEKVMNTFVVAVIPYTHDHS